MRKTICYFVVFILVFFMLASVALAEEAFKPSQASASQTTITTIFTLGVAILFIAAYVLLALRESSKLSPNITNIWPLFIAIVVVAISARVVVAVMFEGYCTDIACFKGWAITVYEQGLGNFYTCGIFADYPPGYMYILYVLGWIREVFAVDAMSAVFTLIIKIPSIIAEVTIAAIAFRIGTKQISKMFGLLCGILILFNPAMFFNSSAWGQIDAVFILFILLTILYLKKENYLLGAFYFAIALLIKPQAIMFSPVVGLAYFYSLFKKRGLKKALVGIFGGAVIFSATVVLVVWPFTGTQEPFWIIDKYAGTVNFYPYASLNAFNLFALTGGNFIDASQPFVFLDYETWGKIFIVLICATVVIMQWKTRDRRSLLSISAFLIISVFMLAHAMHERYILPACILLIFAYIYSRDNATLFFAAAFSITALTNEMVTLYAQGVVAPALPTQIISAFNVVLYLVYAVIMIKRLTTGKVLIKSPAVHG